MTTEELKYNVSNQLNPQANNRPVDTPEQQQQRAKDISEMYKSRVGMPTSKMAPELTVGGTMKRVTLDNKSQNATPIGQTHIKTGEQAATVGGTTAPATPAVGATTMPAATTGGTVTTPVTTAGSTFGQDNIQRINDMYAAQLEANNAQLKAAYDQNLSDAEAAMGKIAPQYQQGANDLAVQYERNRRNLNTQALGNGINTGAASQMGLSQSNEYLRDFGKLRSEEANAMAEAERGILNLKTQYQNAIAAAAADSDYKKAAALLDEYNNQYNRDMSNAQLLAQYGDFSAYANIYGQEAADNMFAIWKAQNPDLAYNTGKITAKEYKAMTGKYPAGYKKSGGGSGYYGSPDGSPGAEPVVIDPKDYVGASGAFYPDRYMQDVKLAEEYNELLKQSQ